MTIPSFSFTTDSIDQAASDVLAVAVRKVKGEPVLVHESPVFDDIRDRLASLGVTGGRDEVVRIPSPIPSVSSIALVGIGGDVTAPALREAAGAAGRIVTGCGTLAFAFPTDIDGAAVATAEGAVLGAYVYSGKRGRAADAARLPATHVIVHADRLPEEADVRAATVTAESMALARDLVNMPSDRLYPETLAEAAVTALSEDAVEVTVLAEEELEDGEFGGLLAVGRGSARGPRLVKLSYRPEGAAKHLALVGKGITFDTGGLSLKPAASMVGMKYDMAGAAAVLAAVRAAARLALPVQITGWLCLAENMPSGDALRPNDVITVRGGTTVEVLNTDAEGRLVLADGLVAAGEEKPDAIVDVATLTGAAIVALGHRYSGVMGDKDLVDRVCEAADRAGELVWPMPLPEELRSGLNSDVADIANARIGNSAAGMLLGAVFLREFATPVDDSESGSGETIPWAHIDIAGTANNPAGGYGFTGKGATGVAVRTLVELAASLGRA